MFVALQLLRPDPLTPLPIVGILLVCRPLNEADRLRSPRRPPFLKLWRSAEAKAGGIIRAGGIHRSKAERVLSMGSFVPTAGSVERQWHVIDAEGQVLGRIATDAARLLQGKHKPVYTPHIDTGDHVVIVNAAKVRLTGRKEEQKLYRYHSGYEGGLREERAKDVRQKNPVRMVEEAVRGMLPKTKLGEAMWRKLKVYAAAEHPHQAQKPKPRAKSSTREVA
jgi:large subunit ribosomal protein L13